MREVVRVLRERRVVADDPLDVDVHGDDDPRHEVLHGGGRERHRDQAQCPDDADEARRCGHHVDEEPEDREGLEVHGLKEREAAARPERQRNQQQGPGPERAGDLKLPRQDGDRLVVREPVEQMSPDANRGGDQRDPDGGK